MAMAILMEFPDSPMAKPTKSAFFIMAAWGAGIDWFCRAMTLPMLMVIMAMGLSIMPVRCEDTADSAWEGALPSSTSSPWARSFWLGAAMTACGPRAEKAPFLKL